MKKMIILATLLIISLGVMVSNIVLKKEKALKQVDKPILEEVLPVLKESSVITKPYNGDNISIISNYYSYVDDFDKQLNSIIYFNDTYMQNTGVIYGADNEFDVLAVADGEVTKISEDVYGKIIEIQHTNELISRYQFLSDVSVSLNSKVAQGDIIGKSGNPNIVDANKSKVFIELILRGQLVDFEKYLGMSLSEI